MDFREAFERTGRSSPVSPCTQRTRILDCSTSADTERKQKQMNSSFRTLLNEHRKKHHFTDLTLVCDQSTFPVHKVVLSSASSYFQDLFLMEREEEPTDTVALQGIDFQVMEVLLEFIYSGTLNFTDLSFEKIGAVFSSAVKLGIFGVNDLFVESMSDVLNRTTFRPMLQLADKMNNRRLVEMVFEFILTNLTPLINGNELRDLSREHFLAVMDRAIDRQCPSEMILQASLAWVKYNPVERRDCIRQLLVNIRLDDVSEVFARFLLEDEELLNDYTRLRERLEIIANHSKRGGCDVGSGPIGVRHRGCGESITLTRADTPIAAPISKHENLSWIRSPLVSELSPRRIGKSSLRDKPALVLVGRDEANRASILFYSLKSEEWSRIEDLGFSLEFKQGLAYCDDLVFFVGGEDTRGTKLTVCYVRDLLTKETKQLADLRIARSGTNVICWRGAIHAVGGVGRYGNSLSHVERLDSLRSTTWRNVQPLREKRDESAVMCELESRIYIMGGGTHKCEFFQPATRTWHELPSLPMEFGQLTPFAAAAGGRIYAFNYYKPQRIYQLGHGNAEWRAVQTKGVLPEWVILATGWKTKIFALDRSLRFFVYDVVENSWSAGARVPRVMPHPTLLQVVDVLDHI